MQMIFFSIFNSFPLVFHYFVFPLYDMMMIIWSILTIIVLNWYFFCLFVWDIFSMMMNCFLNLSNSSIHCVYSYEFFNKKNFNISISAIQTHINTQWQIHTRNTHTSLHCSRKMSSFVELWSSSGLINISEYK